MDNVKYKPLDIVKHQDGSVGIVTEGVEYCSIEWLEGSSNHKSAWWDEHEMDLNLTVIGNIANFLTRNLAHPFGHNDEWADKIYPFK